MKKKLAASLAALMVLSMGTTAVFAANSPDTSTDAGIIEAYLEFNSGRYGLEADTVVCVGTVSGTGVYVSPEDEEGYWTEFTPSTDISLNEDITYYTVYNGQAYAVYSWNGTIEISALYVEDGTEMTLDLYVRSSDYSDDLLLPVVENTDDSASNSASDSSASGSGTTSTGSPKTGDASLSMVLFLLVGGIGIITASKRKSF